jgi:site-specific recombinase XerD
MTTAPLITIFVRHGKDAKGNPCKYTGDEFAKKCACRKHLRWTGTNGVQQRKKAGTRSWAEAELVKRDLEDQLTGKAPAPETAKTIEDAAKVFLATKQTEGAVPATIKKYKRDLIRLGAFCEKHRAYSLNGLTVELLGAFCASWETTLQSSFTRAKTRERLSSFLRFCYDAQWIPRVPRLPKITVDEPPTMPLTEDEYQRLLDCLHVTKPLGKTNKPVDGGMTPKQLARVRALIQLMRWTGLSIRDAITLPTPAITSEGERYRVTTSRQKTGTDVSVVIPVDVAHEVLAAAGERYFIWSGEGNAAHMAGKYTERYIRPAFEAANIPIEGHMVSHRLRDTFAVRLLENGVPMEEVSRALGHTSIRTTERHYAKWVKSRQDRLDSLITGTWTKEKRATRAA